MPGCDVTEKVRKGWKQKLLAVCDQNYWEHVAAQNVVDNKGSRWQKWSVATCTRGVVNSVRDRQEKPRKHNHKWLCNTSKDQYWSIYCPLMHWYHLCCHHCCCLHCHPYWQHSRTWNDKNNKKKSFESLHILNMNNHESIEKYN